MEPVKPIPPNHILRNNLLGVLAAAVVLGLLSRVTDSASTVVFALGYGVQVLVNVILGITRLGNATPPGAAPYFLSALLVLLIGFGACGLMVVTNLGNMH
ncbi:multicomponent K+:H+ antiporter subunit F [Hymenobacter daecheongensis DSM 21074]|uniref:Multicomponent K+:H+ antiporter subunit F n=1 Tax=Hymenobacter daecheongensis DSM 21074 TaxID=1121955 RepID=A0A1M6HZF1_9BACT|nr:hypothetical protein [Hymenobacter daecheongensis]SHJ27543.1 multicomponent K+:H+ antiporter subunit F [Hymenobacter daecheongensis DSM 21074]